VFDSQFPVGAFAFSGGLETYAQLADRRTARCDKEALAELLLHEVELGSQQQFLLHSRLFQS
jgi:urease accessory protein UreF